MSMLKRMPPRRRRLGLTDYRARYKLVKSGLPRLVIRKTNRYIIVQVITSKAGGDETLLTVTSKKLGEYGWRASFKNLPAAYLTGLLAGLLAKKKGVEKAIADIGLYEPIKGSRIFAVVKGFKDAGVDVPASEEVFPEEDRLKGSHIREYFEMLRSGETPSIQFRKMPEEVYSNIEEHFEKVKERIFSEVGGE